MAAGPDLIRERWRRWLAVAAGVAVLLAVPTVVRLVPATDSTVDAGALRDRILASGGQPYAGYAESVGRLGVPPLPQLDSVAALLSGTTRMRVWYAAPDRWRVDDITTGGERGIYRSGGTEYTWDFEDDRLTRIIGQAPVRPPRAADLLPPELARRLLALASGDPVSRLPARRVAGIDAAGVELRPADPETTIGGVRVWADPATGLPLQVEVIARDAAAPVLTSRLLEVATVTPAQDVLTPSAGAGSDIATATAADVTGVLRGFGAAAPPRRLAGRTIEAPPGELPGVGRYGGGLSTFVVVPLSRGLASRLLDGARDGGATAVDVPTIASAMRLQTPLVTVVVVRVRRQGYLLAGAVTAPVLERAAAELAGGRP